MKSLSLMCKGTAPSRKLPSRTIPGQSLLPAELLKRHLAGTLPDIQMNPHYTHDEDGNQIEENLSGLELHELHDLAEKVRGELRERQMELDKKEKEDYENSVIERYKAAEEAKKQQSENTLPGNNPGEGASA